MADVHVSRSRDKDNSSSRRGERDHRDHGDKRRERSPLDRNNAEHERDRHHHTGNNNNNANDLVEENDQTSKKKIASRCRLFVGNLSNEVKEAEMRQLFEKYGEITECFMSSKGFGFVRLDTRAHAETAKENLDGMLLKGRSIRVRYAVHGASLKVTELSTTVSNELLTQAFSIFGEVERAVHILDEKSQPTGEGIIEFERKPGAVDALRRINEGVFLITTNPRPVFVEPLDPKDDEDGLSERMVPKNMMYQKDRAQPPRFAIPGTFEFEFGNRWKELYRVERLRREQLEREFKEAREKLENDTDLAYQEYQTAQLREDLRRRQEELDRMEAARRERAEMYRLREEERARARQQQQQQQMAQHAAMYPGSQMQPPYHIIPQYQQNADPRYAEMHLQRNDVRKDQMLPQRHIEAARVDGRPAVVGVVAPPNMQRPDDQLAHGVQKLMQMMQQQGSQPQTNRLSGTAATGQNAGAVPIDIQQQQQQRGQPVQRPNLLSNPVPPFSDEKERRGWILEQQERSRAFLR